MLPPTPGWAAGGGGGGAGASGVVRRAGRIGLPPLARRHALTTLPLHCARRVDRRGEGSIYDDDRADARRVPWARPPPSENSPSAADAANSGPRAIASPWRPPAAYRPQTPSPGTKATEVSSGPTFGPYCVWPWPEDDEDKEDDESASDPARLLGPRRTLTRPAVARRYRSLIGGTGFPIPTAYAVREVVVGGDGPTEAPPAETAPPPKPRRRRAAAAPTPPSPSSSPSWLSSLVSKARQSWRDQWDVLSALGGDGKVGAAVRRSPGRPRKATRVEEEPTGPPRPRAVGRPRKEPLGPKPAPLPRGRPKGSKSKRDGRPPPSSKAATATIPAALRASSNSTAIPVVYHRAPFRAEARRAAADAAAGDPRGGRTLAITFFDDGGGALGAYRGALAAAALRAALAREPGCQAALAAAGINLRIRVASITRLTLGAARPPPADPRLVAAAEAAGIALDPSATALDPAAPHGADAVVESDLALVMDAYDAEELVREAAGMEAVCPRGAYTRRVRPFGLYAARPGSCPLPQGSPSSSSKSPLFPASTPDIDDPWTYGGGGGPQEAWAEAWSFNAAAVAAVAQVAAAAAGLAAHLAHDIAGAAVVRAGTVSPRAALAAAGLCPLLTAEADADWRRSVAPTRRRRVVLGAAAARKQAQQASSPRRPTITRPPALAVTNAPARALGWAPLWLEDELPPGAAAMFATVGRIKDEEPASAPPLTPPVLYTLREKQPGAPPRPVRLGRMPSRHWAADPARVDEAVRAYMAARGDEKTAAWLPTRAELSAGGASSLSAAMAKVAGGSTAVAARTGLRPKRMTPGTWDEEGILGAALREAAAKAGRPGVMPSHATLRAMGEHRLAHAVRKAGGSAVVAAGAGLGHEPRRGKPPSSWMALGTPDAPTLRYLVTAVDPAAVAAGRMPSRASILASSVPGAAQVVTRAGGVKAVAALLGLEFVGAARGRRPTKKADVVEVDG